MAFRLAADSLAKAIQHLCKFGDTDVFPHLPELAFFRDEIGDALVELSVVHRSLPGRFLVTMSNIARAAPCDF